MKVNGLQCSESTAFLTSKTHVDLLDFHKYYQPKRGGRRIKPLHKPRSTSTPGIRPAS